MNRRRGNRKWGMGKEGKGDKRTEGIKRRERNERRRRREWSGWAHVDSFRGLAFKVVVPNGESTIVCKVGNVA